MTAKYSRAGRTLRAMLAGTAIALVASTAVAQTQAQLSRNFNIPAQPAGEALNAFARQSGLRILFPYDAVAGKRTRALTGAMTADKALQQLLADTGLAIISRENGVVTLSAEGNGRASVAELQGPGEGAAQGGDLRSDGAADEIVVTGSIIRGAAPSGANLIVLGREDLENTGRGTLAGAIQTVPQVHGGGRNDAMTRTGGGAAPNSYGESGLYGSASLNLRGLGVEETLTLVNGRRLAPTGTYGAFADISVLPMAAVERVEILADGASATYGADAMAGVVNIIMNRRFEGAETRMRAGLETRSGQPEFQASQTFGWAFDRGNILVAADYARQDGVTEKGRPYAASADLRPFGGSDHRQNYCNPGNIVPPSPTELVGAIPTGQDGRALMPDQIRRGENNRCDIYADSSHLTPETERGSLYLAGAYDVTDRLRLSADIIATKRITKTSINNHFMTLAVPVSNAYRQMNGFNGDTAPLDQDIYINYLFGEVNPPTLRSDTWSLLASLSADYRFGGDWQLSLTAGYGRDDSTSKVRGPDTRPASEGGALAQALASSDPATAFNPFGDISANSRELVESFLVPSHTLQKNDYHSASLSLSGSLVELPAGAMKLAVGGDYRRESLGSRLRYFYANLAPGYHESRAFQADRNVAAAYAELFIPLFSERNAVSGARRLSVSLSGRYDHYSDFGSTFNPKAGVTWVPLEGLKLKGSYGTSFKAPLLFTLYNGSRVEFFFLPQSAGAPDVNGDGFVSTMYASGGNPELGPEKGKSWTAGVEIEPAALEGLRLHATYFNLHFSGRFSEALYPDVVFSNPAAYQDIAYFPLPLQSQVGNLIAAADRVDGVPPPAESIEAIIDSRTMNLASQVMDGVDAGASYRWEALGGTFDLSGNVSYLSRYKSRLGQSVEVKSYLGNVGLPTRWKARGGLSWTGGGVSLNGWVNHTPGYKNKLIEPQEAVSSYTTVDLSLQAQLVGWARDLVGDGATLAFYVTNLFDRAPPFVDYHYGYDGANADPVGRRVAVQLIKRW